MLQGWQLIPILLVLALLILAVLCLTARAQQISNRKSAEWLKDIVECTVDSYHQIQV